MYYVDVDRKYLSQSPANNLLVLDLNQVFSTLHVAPSTHVIDFNRNKAFRTLVT